MLFHGLGAEERAREDPAERGKALVDRAPRPIPVDLVVLAPSGHCLPEYKVSLHGFGTTER